MTNDARLHTVEPREQSGPRTGARYEYQYHQAAAAALSLIEGQVQCVYCDWHDDFVSESESSDDYLFSQVKTRAKAKGPWSLNEFFGRGKKPKGKPRPVTADSIFGRLWDHTIKFSQRCKRFTFVSDAGLEGDFEQLLSEAKTASRPSNLSTLMSELFNDLQSDLTTVFPDVTDVSLFQFLSRLHAQEGVGSLSNLEQGCILIANRILEASEVDILLSQARQIGSDLITEVRKKSHTVLPVLPQSKEALRQSKGLIVDNILVLLSLSTDGFRELKANGRDSVVALSRLQRLCKKNEVAPALIPDLCRYKTEWTAWWTRERDNLNTADFLVFKNEAASLLVAHSAGKLSFQQLADEAKTTAAKYDKVLTSRSPITPELVIGFTIQLAVEAED